MGLDSHPLTMRGVPVRRWPLSTFWISWEQCFSVVVLLKVLFYFQFVIDGESFSY